MVPKSGLVDLVFCGVHGVPAVGVSSFSLNLTERVPDWLLERERVWLLSPVAAGAAGFLCCFASPCPSCSRTAATMAGMDVVRSVVVCSGVHRGGFRCLVRSWCRCRGLALHFVFWFQSYPSLSS